MSDPEATTPHSLRFSQKRRCSRICLPGGLPSWKVSGGTKQERLGMVPFPASLPSRKSSLASEGAGREQGPELLGGRTGENHPKSTPLRRAPHHLG